MENEKRDSFIFYRSFYEAIIDLPEKEQIKIFRAIADYSLNMQEPELKGIAGTVFKLIKPQIEANIKRYKNGKQPKDKQNGSKSEAKDKQEESKSEANKNENKNENENKNKEYPPEIENLYSELIPYFADVQNFKADKPENKDVLIWCNKNQSIDLETLKKVLIFGRTDEFWKTVFISFKGLKTNGKNGNPKILNMLAQYTKQATQAPQPKKNQVVCR